MNKVLLILPMLALAACGGVGSVPPPPGTIKPQPEPAPTALFIPEVGAAVGTGDGTKVGTVYVSPNLQEVAMMQFVNELRTKGTLGGRNVIPGSCVDGTFTPGALKELTYNGVLAYAARKHSDYAASYGYEVHDETQASHPMFYGARAQDRVTRAYNELAPGHQAANNWTNENVGFGYDQVADIMEAFMQSPGHCRGIMNPDARKMGMGWSSSGKPGVYSNASGQPLSMNNWVQLFGK